MAHDDEPANSIMEMGVQWGWDQGWRAPGGLFSGEMETQECAQDYARLANKMAEPQSAVSLLYLPMHTVLRRVMARVSACWPTAQAGIWQPHSPFPCPWEALGRPAPGIPFLALTVCLPFPIGCSYLSEFGQRCVCLLPTLIFIGGWCVQGDWPEGIYFSS